MKRGFMLAALVLIVPFIFCGCSGNDGATGAAGAPGAPGAPGTPGTPGAPGGTAAVAEKHGAPALAAEELAVENKYRVDVTIDSATADTAGVVTVNFTVMNGTSPVTNIPNTYNTSVSAGIFKLAPAGGGFSYNRWVPYIWRTEEVSGTQDDDGNPFVKPSGYTTRQASRESSGTGATNGTLVNHGDGSYTYTFRKNLATATLPDNVTLVGYERSRTHRVSVYIGGHSGATGEGDFDFVPDGSPVTETRDIVETATCRKCHGPAFDGHGGDRVTVEGCNACHSPDSEDAQSGESIEMAVMVHKIHAGNELPTNAGPDGHYYNNPWTPADETADNFTPRKYILWGNRTAPHSWEGAAFPAVLANCRSCHTGGGADVDNWKNVPSRAACGSCHDTIDWVTGANHSDGDRIMLDDNTCVDCHPATGTPVPPAVGKSVTAAHNWTAKDIRNIPEFDVALSVNTPSRGYFIEGESPVISIALTDKVTHAVVVPSTVREDSSAEGCIPRPGFEGTECTVPRDGLFRAASIYVTGPRGQRIPVLTYAARAEVSSANAGPWDLTALAEDARKITVKVDSGTPMVTYNNQFVYEGFGADELIPGTVTVTLPAAVLAPADVAAALNANGTFHERALAYVDEGPAVLGRLSIRSRGISKMEITPDYNLLVNENTAQPNVQVVGASPAGMFAANAFGAGGGAGQGRIRNNAANNDPKADFSDPTAIRYTLDPVDDLAPGTYAINVEFGDAGRGLSTDDGGINPPEPPYIDYRAPSVAVATFNVKTADTAKFPGNVEKPIADGCSACHWSDAGVGFILDYPRHAKLFNDQAVDHCGGCHDYTSGMNPASTYADWGSGGKPTSRRVHAVHNGVNLTYPTLTVGHEETSAFGRNWRIAYPMDVRNCESCHSSATSGTWMTNPNRLACMGCHDSDAATAHMKTQTYDPTPLAPWSGDEQESCQACH